MREWSGTGSLVNFVVSMNLHRRHLSQSQRAMLGAKSSRSSRRRPGNGCWPGRAQDPVADLPQGRARDQAAQMVHVSPRSVDAATKVREQGAPELIQAVETGEVSVSAAAELAELPREEQVAAVAGGKKAVAAKAKQSPQENGQPQQTSRSRPRNPGRGSRRHQWLDRLLEVADFLTARVNAKKGRGSPD